MTKPPVSELLCSPSSISPISISHALVSSSDFLSCSLACMTRATQLADTRKSSLACAYAYTLHSRASATLAHISLTRSLSQHRVFLLLYADPNRTRAARPRHLLATAPSSRNPTALYLASSQRRLIILLPLFALDLARIQLARRSSRIQPARRLHQHATSHPRPKSDPAYLQASYIRTRTRTRASDLPATDCLHL